ncbi:THAP domain-containing protein 5-like [Ischnura elegans]|uniref:THAP domain-containing protein 5-like n=1 Tax=Ischnura elegans TaxID=197161 RepID=UPI001ED89998|nr:THAP domain-containing protein 5-like [Ischnura elegans]
MVNKCCVPHCRGNYAGGEKVSVFRFPEEDELKKKWIRRIPRENFIPTEYSRVCIKHFLAHDVYSETSAFDEKTGKVITVKLPTPRLKAGAVPFVFLGCPSYLSSASSSREEPETKRLRLEMKHLERCIKESEEKRRLSEEKVKFKDSCELHNKLGECDWLGNFPIVKKGDELLLCYITTDPVPEIRASVLVGNDLEVRSFLGTVSLKTVGNSKFPMYVNQLICFYTTIYLWSLTI